MERLPVPAEGVVCQAVSGGAVVLDTEREVYFGLNETGLRIWERLAAGTTPERLFETLEAAHPDVDRERIRAEASALLRDLADAGLVLDRAAGGAGEPS